MASEQRRYNVVLDYIDILVVSAPIVGLNSVERIHEMAEAVNIELSDEEIKHLEEPYVTRSVAGDS